LVTGLDETQFVEFLEAVYALDRGEDEWLTQSLRALSRLCGREYNYVGFFYDASNVEDLKVGNICRLQNTPPELAAVWSLFRSIVNPGLVRSTFRSLLAGSARKSAFDYMQPLLAARERNGHGDFFFLNGLDPSGLGCALMLGSRQQEFAPQAKEVALLKRAATHLSAAYRCWRRLAPAKTPQATPAELRDRVTTGAEAILDASGRVVHAEGAAESRAARERIQRAAAAIESARTKSRRGRGVDALDRWHPLTGARWTLVDSFEEGGRRYVVARENQVDLQGFGALTDRERQIVVHAALGLTNKEIAYALGVSDVTVRVLLARAARRLGVRGRRELLSHSTLRDLRPAVESEH
jgi:DNA-binding CsgD family transcriptional regulator